MERLWGTAFGRMPTMQLVHTRAARGGCLAAAHAWQRRACTCMPGLRVGARRPRQAARAPKRVLAAAAAADGRPAASGIGGASADGTPSASSGATRGPAAGAAGGIKRGRSGIRPTAAGSGAGSDARPHGVVIGGGWGGLGAAYAVRRATACGRVCLPVLLHAAAWAACQCDRMQPHGPPANVTACSRMGRLPM
eukprot:366050-Chlamydomonas_euryale.AAC.10